MCVLLLSATLSGCGYMAYFFRGAHEEIEALEVRNDPDERSDCLIVMMPGLGDTKGAPRDSCFARTARAGEGKLAGCRGRCRARHQNTPRIRGSLTAASNSTKSIGSKCEPESLAMIFKASMCCNPAR